ncbi:hypothetical protein QBC38DRAFT_477271 [Podospora fimiseda]|uniref:BSD domain-containing protein n=1 Tax=Podospora fimiseda TaxID=252190 RepID=A0AAN7BR42_9PEZI|nr:hypothetical protein QBC38DRAFT_477271 [Podospora fimiseda]
MALPEIPKGRTSYKKKEGILTLTDDRQSLIWSPLPANGPPTVSLALDKILNLKQTPDTSPKVILKIIEKPKTPKEQEGQSFMFQFTSPSEARTEANALRDLLSQLLAELRGGDAPKPVQPASGGATPSAKPPSMRWFDDDSLKADIDLQLSLLKKDIDLAKTHSEALALKSDAISDAAFNTQFWSSRVGLLRAHAFELHQKKGSYNVLSTVKPRAENGEFKLSLSPEQIQSILHQHPLVRRIYNENVPKLTEPEFWSRFFLSKLAKQLRGERITDVDNSDALFDRYLGADNSLGFASKITAAQHVPAIIDLEANEENQGGFKGGNRKDAEMRPRANIPIIKTLNSLSEKIMADVAPADFVATPIGTTPAPDAAPDKPNMDETRVFSELALHDLRGDTEAGRIKLNVKDQPEFFSNHGGDTNNNLSLSEENDDASIFAKQNPEEVLFDVIADLETIPDDGAGGIDLHTCIGVNDDSESDTNTLDKKPLRVGSKAARKAAELQILDGMRKARTENIAHNSSDNTSLMESPMGIPPDITERCYLTQAATTEFLKQFWTAFLSEESPEKQQSLKGHIESLKKCIERIESITADAEKVRVQVAERRKKEIQEVYQKTGKKLKWVPPKGGKEQVMALFEATLGALEKAIGLYTPRGV